MKIKKICFTGVFCLGMIFAGVTPASANTDIATLNELQAKVEYMQSVMSELAAQLEQQKLQAATASITEPDEGLLQVFVKDSLVFPCEGKAETSGELCVRHYSDSLGVSYIDLGTISGFTYNENSHYDLTLIKTRSEMYGQTNTPQYDYTLLKLVEPQ